MTQEQINNLTKVFNANADKQLGFDVVINSTLKALCTDVLTSAWAKRIIGEYGTPERKAFREAIALHMPHFVLNGTNKVIICDFITATDSNRGSKAIRQYRLSVDSEIVKPTNCAFTVKTEKEVNKIEKIALKSGWEIEVPSRDKDGELIKETVQVELVPRKKSVWGYTKDVKTAIINAIDYIEANAK